MPVEERRPPKKQKAVEFDFKTAVKTTLPDDIQRAMNIMVSGRPSLSPSFAGVGVLPYCVDVCNGILDFLGKGESVG